MKRLGDNTMKPAGPAAMDFKKTPPATDTKRQEKLRKACKDFEAIMLQQMLKTMRQSIPKGGLVDQSHASDLYRSMQDEELAKAMANGRGTGLADFLYKRITRETKTTTIPDRQNP